MKINGFTMPILVTIMDRKSQSQESEMEISFIRRPLTFLLSDFPDFRTYLIFFQYSSTWVPSNNLPLKVSVSL